MPRNVIPVLLVATMVSSASAHSQGVARTVADTAWIHTASGLTYTVLARGTGPTARSGQTVSIHETTTLPNGVVVFTSRTNDKPVVFRLGAKQVIAGVEEGVTGMTIGERRLLIVPPALSVRSSYPANTPRDSTLRIDIELMAIRP